MSWITRYGLNIITDSNTIDDIDINQNIKSRIALGRFLAEVLCGGEGIYDGGAENIGDLTSGNNYPISSIVIYDDNGYPWYFETTSDTSINFDISSGNGVLYAIIKTESMISPLMASANYDDLEFWVYSEDTDAPDNSLKLGYGTIVASAFTSYTIYDTSFSPVNISSYFYIKGNTGITKLINSKNTLQIIGQNGITITNPSDLQINIGPDFNASGGLMADGTGMALKLKGSGGLAKDALGLYVSSVASPQFTLAGDSGSNQTISNSNTLNLLGSNAILTTASSINELHIAVALATESGLVEDSASDYQLGIKLKDDSGLSLTSSGLSKIDSYFLIESDLGNNKSIFEDNNFEIYGKDAIATSRTTGNTIDVSLTLGATPGLEQDADGLKLKLKPGGGLSTGPLGLRYAEYDNADMYGHPIVGFYEIGDFYRDKSGALWVCERAGIPGEWGQINVGTTAEITDDSFSLPTSAQFNGGYIPPGYKIRWNYLSDMTNFVTSPTSMVWIWHLENIEKNYGFWISEDIFRVKLERENEFINFNASNLVSLSNDPNNNVGTKHFSIIESGGYGALSNIYQNSVSNDVFRYDLSSIARRSYTNNRWVLNLNNENDIEGTYGTSAQKYTGFYIENMNACIASKINSKYASENITSTSSLTIGYGLQTIIVNEIRLLLEGDRIRIAYTITPANYMEGIITAIDIPTLTISVMVDVVGGSGTQSSWTITPNRTIKLAYYEQTDLIASYDHDCYNAGTNEVSSAFEIINRPVKYVNNSKELAYWEVDSGPCIYGDGSIKIGGAIKILKDQTIGNIFNESTKSKLLLQLSGVIYERIDDNTTSPITLSSFTPLRVGWDGTYYWALTSTTLYKRTPGTLGSTAWVLEGAIPDVGYLIYSTAGALNFYDDGTGLKPYILAYKNATGTKLYRYDGANTFTTIDTDAAGNSTCGREMWSETQGLLYSPTGTAGSSVIKLYTTNGVGASTLLSDGDFAQIYYLSGGYSGGKFYLYIGESAQTVQSVNFYYMFWSGAAYSISTYTNSIYGTADPVAVRGFSYNTYDNSIYMVLSYTYDVVSETTIWKVPVSTGTWALVSYLNDNYFSSYSTYPRIQEVGHQLYLQLYDNVSTYNIYKFYNDESISDLDIDCPQIESIEFDFDIDENIDCAIQIVADIRYMIDLN